MINLPILFETKLKKNAKLHSGVRTALDNFEPWLEQSGMPFFPGFTDHSPRHINEVLNTAAAIISDESHSLLSPEDVTALTLAVLLHDCGMHLTQDGFRNLIANYPPKLINGFDDKPWTDLWNDFLGEAQRFGEDRLIAIFGDSEPVHVDSIDINNLSERDLLLAGEFIRRHHARLAHEIAIYGTPSKDENKLSLKDIDPDLQDIAGLIARSHNLSIRETFSYITEKYSRLTEYREIKIPYLMAVVRIADYIQVQSERALKSLLSVKELRSPISRQEWKNHFAVRNVSTRHEDPEALYVHADPIDVKTYLRLDSLFKDIQRELDLSWAAIGEIYGRFGDLKKLGLTIRRLRSNIDDLKKFSRTVQYIPTRAGFGTSGPDLLKLLVGPLYDYDYSVGIRELLQNSADACKELIDIQNKGQKREADDPEVKLEISETENGDGWITVSDSGVGMTLETVQTYFLTAGASFRNSDAWKKLHLDEAGNSRVLRGGRFGVGALAAFLLGDEIHVTTRYFNRSDSEGIEFKAKINDPIIELRRCTAQRGTTIRIWVNNTDVLKKLRPHAYGFKHEGQHLEIEHWNQVDWYKQKFPKIHCNWSGDYQTSFYDESSKIRVSASYIRKDDFSPSPNESDNEDWTPLKDSGSFKAIYWRYPTTKSYPKPTDDIDDINNDNNQDDSDSEKLFYKIIPPREVIVNGIHVETLVGYRPNSLLKIKKSTGNSPSFSINRPSLSIVDPNGICPINLQRSSIAFEKMDVDENIGKDVLDDYITSIQKETPNTIDIRSLSRLVRKMNGHDGIQFSHVVPVLAATNKGFFLTSNRSFSDLRIERLFFAQLEFFDDTEADLSSTLRDGEAIIIAPQVTGTKISLSWFRSIFSELENSSYKAYDSGFPNLGIMSAVSILPTAKWKLASSKGRITRQILKHVTASKSTEEFTILFHGDKNPLADLLDRAEFLRNQIPAVAEISCWHIRKKPKPSDDSLLAEVWFKHNKGHYLRAPKKTKLNP